MRTAGLIVSVVGHLILIAWGVVSLASTPILDVEVEALPVELVQLDEVTDLSKGLTTAALAPEPSPNDPAPEAKEEPQAMPPLPDARRVRRRHPLPPEAASPEETASDESEPTSEPQPDPATEPDAAEPPPEPSAADAQQQPPENAAIKDPVPLPKTRPDRPAPPTPENSDSDFNPDTIAALLDRNPPTASAAASEEPASLGVPAENVALRMTQNELSALRAQIQRCWVIPTGWTHPREVSVTIRFRLSRDGTVSARR